MTISIQQQAKVPVTLCGQRLDQIAVKLFPEFSRERLKRWINEGALTVDTAQRKPSDRLYGGELLLLAAVMVDQQQWIATDQPVPHLYEDEHLIIINKPIDCVVHPAPGHYEDTLVNALLYQYPELRRLPRAGIVHRLDKDTSGVMMVARSLVAHPLLVQQLQNRSVSRIYQALVYGTTPATGTIDTYMARDPHNRTRMAVLEQGKRAVTHYRTLKHFESLSLVELSLETGRTHQIRVHLQHLGFPIVGDPVYRQGQTNHHRLDPTITQAISDFKRQALHAKTLSFIHPMSQQPVVFMAPLADDISDLLALLEALN